MKQSDKSKLRIWAQRRRFRPVLRAVIIAMVALSAAESRPEVMAAGGSDTVEIGHFAATGLAQASSMRIAAGKRAEKHHKKSYDGYTIIGAAEEVMIYPQEIRIRAKIDTGAKSSSIDAELLATFKREGADWVRFKMFGDNNSTHELELPVARKIRIRRAGVATETRLAVVMRLCLGTVAADVVVNFAERRSLIHRMLLGRDFLKGRFLVDSDPRFLTKPSCKSTRPK